jgi:hypothetical protein
MAHYEHRGSPVPPISQRTRTIQRTTGRKLVANHRAAGVERKEHVGHRVPDRGSPGRRHRSDAVENWTDQRSADRDGPTRAAERELRYHDSQITATSGAITLKNDLRVYPLLGAVGLAGSTVTGGQSVQGTIYLNDRAPLGGALVTLQSNNGAAQVPNSVTVPQGQTSVSFTVTTSVVAANTPGVITAGYAGAQETANLTVAP